MMAVEDPIQKLALVVWSLGFCSLSDAEFRCKLECQRFAIQPPLWHPAPITTSTSALWSLYARLALKPLRSSALDECRYTMCCSKAHKYNLPPTYSYDPGTFARFLVSIFSAQFTSFSMWPDSETATLFASILGMPAFLQEQTLEQTTTVWPVCANGRSAIHHRLGVKQDLDRFYSWVPSSHSDYFVQSRRIRVTRTPAVGRSRRDGEGLLV
ncbi:hypothetical protein C8R45DRAFT_993555 [Mycena sanguinolenta]|nr:hypothetical protein C8R45DRAFT_993555 [Mycena sanguinolenta]